MARDGDRDTDKRAILARALTTAVAHHRAGRIEQAVASYRKVLDREPGNADALHLLGVIALEKGRPRRATQLICKALAAMPDFAEAYSNLGNAQRAEGRSDEACASYRRAIALDPSCGAAHNNLGLLLCEKRDFEVALAHCRRAVELAPNLAEAHNNLGNALRGLGQPEAAVGAFGRALQLEPSAARQTNLANALADLGRFAEAEAGYRRAIALNPGFGSAHYGLATQLRRRGAVDEAVASYRRALALSPREAAIWNDLGGVLRALGRFEQAAQAFRRALEIDPKFADAYRNLASCRQLTGSAAEVAQLAALVQTDDLPVEERASAGFALGKVLDDCGRFDEAFAAYDQANRVYREARAKAGDRFDAKRLRRVVEDTITRYTLGYFASVAGWGNPSELPVFVVGLPRSGTSLVEQVAASHSQVFGAGELREIGELAAAFGATLRINEVRRLSDVHLARLQALGGSAARVIDKMPDNVFTLGIIATLFPAARVVFCRRDPIDICLSCYFQKFNVGQLTFSYDLADCACRYRETERLIAHWRRVLPLRMFDLQYETMIADLEGKARSLLEFLGLDWEPACLEFHRTRRTVATASGWQVRQPIYSSSVGRWRHYATHLGPLYKALGVMPSGAQVEEQRTRDGTQPGVG